MFDNIDPCTMKRILVALAAGGVGGVAGWATYKGTGAAVGGVGAAVAAYFLMPECAALPASPPAPPSIQETIPGVKPGGQDITPPVIAIKPPPPPQIMYTPMPAPKPVPAPVATATKPIVSSSTVTRVVPTATIQKTTTVSSPLLSQLASKLSLAFKPVTPSCASYGPDWVWSASANRCVMNVR